MGANVNLQQIATTFVGGVKMLFGSNTNIANYGKRNYYTEYDYLESVVYEHSHGLYTRSPYAKRVVDFYPDSIWSNKFLLRSDTNINELVNGDYDDQDNLIGAGLAQKNNIYTSLSIVDKLSKIGLYSILVIGINDGKNLSTPVLKSVGGNNEVTAQITYLQAFGFDKVKIYSNDDDVNSANFGKPLMYEILQRGSSKKIYVHYTRVLHVLDGLLDDPVYGTPLMSTINNSLRDILKVMGGSSEIFYLNSRKGLVAKVDGLLNLGKEELKTLKDSFHAYLESTDRVLFTDDMEVKDLGSDHIDPSAIVSGLIDEIAAAGKLPRSVMIGGSNNDKSSLHDRTVISMNARHEFESRCAPRILRPFIEKLQNMGVLISCDFEIIWQDIFELNKVERADVAAKQARSFISVCTGHTLTGESIMTGAETHHIVAAGDAYLETNREITLEILNTDTNRVNANIGDGETNSENNNNNTSDTGTTDKVD